MAGRQGFNLHAKTGYGQDVMTTVMAKFDCPASKFREGHHCTEIGTKTLQGQILMQQCNMGSPSPSARSLALE